MSDNGFRAVVTDTWTTFMFDHARLIVVDDRAGRSHRRVLMSDGSWQEDPGGAGTVAGDGAEVGLIIPKEAFEAIARAIQEWQGHASHADTEARVLREWLAVERARVDRLIPGQ